MRVTLTPALIQCSGETYWRPYTTKGCSGWVSDASYTCAKTGTYLAARTGCKQRSGIRLRDKLCEIEVWCSKTRGAIPPVIAIRSTVFTSNGWLHPGRSKSNSSPRLGKYEICYTGTSISQCKSGILTKPSTVGVQLLDYFDKISDMFQKLGNKCPRYDKIGNLFADSPSLQESIAAFYAIALTFCTKALHFLQTPSKFHSPLMLFYL